MIWAGSASHTICWDFTAGEGNPSDRHLALYDTATGEVVDGGFAIPDQHTVLPPEAAGCTEFYIGHLKPGVLDYTIKMEGPDRTYATRNYKMAQAVIDIDYSPNSNGASLINDAHTEVTFRISWHVLPAEAATLLDAIAIWNTHGGYVDFLLTTTGEKWYYSNGKPQASGFKDVTFPIEANHPPGGYTAKFYSNFVWSNVGISTSFINWEDYPGL